jgi:Zn-dependent protease
MEKKIQFDEMNPEDQLDHCRKFAKESNVEDELRELMQVMNEDYEKPEEDQTFKWRKTFLSWGLSLFGCYLVFGFDILITVCVMVTFTIHELGHFLMQKKYSFKNISMSFYGPLGAAVSGESQNKSASGNFWMYLMGPLPGIIISFIVFLLLDFFYQKIPDSISTNFFIFAAVSLYINAFNLFPASFLDGGRIFSICFDKFPRFSWIMNIVMSVSLLVYLSVEIYHSIIVGDLISIILTAIPTIIIFLHLRTMAKREILTIKKISIKSSKFFVERYGEIPNVIDYDMVSYVHYHTENCEHDNIYIYEVWADLIVPPSEFQRKLYITLYFSLILFTGFIFYYFLQ